jgi:putative phosphonate metabolism protein
LHRRFAIYAVPGVRSADTVGVLLRQKAEQWLGRSVSGDPVTPGVPVGWTRAAIDAMTASARRYGFHATLKPPFRLAEGRTAEELDAAVARFAAGSAGAVIPRLTLGRLGGFFAFVPGAEAPGLHALAAEVVERFDDFRAPMTGAELARHDHASLTPRQRELLTRWGYPYVLDEFRFHLTLTDRIPDGRRSAVERALRDWFAASLGATVSVDALALFTEAEPGAPFTLRAVHPLRPSPREPTTREPTTRVPTTREPTTREPTTRVPTRTADSEGAR